MPPARRPRAASVAENDEALRSAAAEMTVEVGWDAVTFTGVAKRAGLTVGAVYGRAESTTELAIDLWEHSVRQWFQESLECLLEAAKAGDVSGVARETARWGSGDGMPSVLVELLIASLFDPDMADVIRMDAQRLLGRWVRPHARAPRVDPSGAAAATLVSSFALGRALAALADDAPLHVAEESAKVNGRFFSQASGHDSVPKGPRLRWVRSMDELDSQTRAVFLGTIDTVGRVGYRRATIARIARTAKVPRGSVLGHYADKASLVADAARHALIPPREVWEQYSPVIDVHGPLLSRAMFLEDFLRPANRPWWALNLELARMSRVIPALADFMPRNGVLEQTHLGVMLVASLSRDLSKLPFSGAFRAGTAT